MSYNNSNDKCPVIIPSYEPDTMLNHLCASLKDAGIFNFIVIDDGSGQEYQPIFEMIEKNYHCKILRHAVNLGKGRALKNAFNYVLNECPNAIGVITADSDGQHTPDDIKRCMLCLCENPESLILGCRKFQGDHVPWRSRIGNKLTKNIFRYVCGIKISDTQTGLRGIPKSLMLDALTIKGERFDYETNMLLNAHDKCSFIEVPIETIYESKSNHKTHFEPLYDSFMIYSLIFFYLFSSILSVLIDFSIFSLSINTGGNIWIATMLGRLCSTIVNFTVNRSVVFKSKGSIFKQWGGYLALVCVSGIISALMVHGLSQIFGGKIIILKAIVEGSLFFFNYYVQRNIIFAKKRENKSL